MERVWPSLDVCKKCKAYFERNDPSKMLIWHYCCKSGLKLLKENGNIGRVMAFNEYNSTAIKFSTEFKIPDHCEYQLEHLVSNSNEQTSDASMGRCANERGI